MTLNERPTFRNASPSASRAGDGTEEKTGIGRPVIRNARSGRAFARKAPRTDDGIAERSHP